MANLILHIGCHRTGSSSIQAALLAARSRLRRIGVLYPRTGLITQAHHAFGYGILGQSSAWGKSPTCDELRESLAAEVAASGCPSVVVSSELFTDIVDAAAGSDEVSSRLRHFLDMFSRVRVLCFVRHQVPLLESMYRFEVLWKHTAEQRCFYNYAQQRMADPHFDYQAIGTRLRSIRPDAKVEFLSFAAASKARAVVSHFFARAGVESAYRGEVWINQSQSRLGTLAILLRNQGHAGSTLGRSAFVNWTRRAFPMIAESLYDADLARRVGEMFGEANDTFADIAGFRLNDELGPFVLKNRLAGHEFTPQELGSYEIALRRRQAWPFIERIRDEVSRLAAKGRTLVPVATPKYMQTQCGDATDR